MRAGRVYGFNADAVRFFAQELIVGISHLHKNGVLHRDIKPGNVMLDARGHIRLIDFGCARETAQNLDDITDAKADRCTTLCGTTAYLSLETLRGEGYSKGVDWWALGVTLYELHAGELPFPAPENEALQDDPGARAAIVK